MIAAIAAGLIAGLGYLIVVLVLAGIFIAFTPGYRIKP